MSAKLTSSVVYIGCMDKFPAGHSESDKYSVMTNRINESTQGSSDRRKHPRIAFHVPVSVMGLNENARVVDFSLNGFFVQIDARSKLKEGQQVRLALKFPHGKTSTVIKAKVVHIDQNGFGCQFLHLSSSINELLEKNFDIYSGTIPIE